MDHPKPKVFIVEDEAIIADEIANLLKKQGYQIAGKSNSGEDALIKTTENNPDLILMDIHLKGKLNGIETADKINAINNIPVIFITAYPEEVTNNPSYLNHPYACLNKPFQEKDLFCQITASIHQKENIKKLNTYSQWMQTILNSMTTGIIMLSVNNDIDYLNKTAELMLNQSSHNLLGKKYHVLLDELDSTDSEKSELSIFSTHYTKPFSMKFKGLTQDKTSSYIQLCTKPYFDANGTFAGSLIELHDIHKTTNKINELKDEVDQVNLAKEMQEENAANLADLVETMNIENDQLQDVIQYFELYYHSQLEKINHQIKSLQSNFKQFIMPNLEDQNIKKKLGTSFKNLQDEIKFSSSNFSSDHLFTPHTNQSFSLASMLVDLEKYINKEFGKYFKTAFYYSTKLPSTICIDKNKLTKLFFYLLKQTLQITNIYDISY